ANHNYSRHCSPGENSDEEKNQTSSFSLLLLQCILAAGLKNRAPNILQQQRCLYRFPAGYSLTILCRKKTECVSPHPILLHQNVSDPNTISPIVSILPAHFHF